MKFFANALHRRGAPNVDVDADPFGGSIGEGKEGNRFLAAKMGKDRSVGKRGFDQGIGSVAILPWEAVFTLDQSFPEDPDAPLSSCHSLSPKLA